MRIKGKVRRFRKVVRSLLGTDVRVRPTLAVPTMTLGNAHAEWTFCPTGLDESSVVYSVGIGEDVSFDTALIERFGVAVYAFDPTPRSLAWIERQTLPDKLHVVPVGLAGQCTRRSIRITCRTRCSLPVVAIGWRCRSSGW